MVKELGSGSDHSDFTTWLSLLGRAQYDFLKHGTFFLVENECFVQLH